MRRGKAPFPGECECRPRVPYNPLVIPGMVKGKPMRSLNYSQDIICEQTATGRETPAAA